MLYLNNFLSYIRDGVIISLFLLCFDYKKFRMTFTKGVKLFYAYLWIIYLLSIIFTPVPMGVGFFPFYRMHTFLILFYITFWIEDIKLVLILNLLVKLSILLVFTNFIGYFWLGNLFERSWGVRISVGYPTIDTVTYCFSLIVVLLNKELHYHVLKRTIYSFILIVGLISSFSGTGSLSLLFVLIGSSIVVFIFRQTQVTSRKTICLLLILTTIAVFLTPHILGKDNEIIYRGSLLLEAKYKNIIGDEDASSNTWEARKAQYEYNSKKYNYNDARKIFGLSINAFTRDTFYAKKYLYCENMLDAIKIGLGYVGLIIFFLFNIQLLHILYKKNDRFIFYCGLITCGVFMFGSNTTCTMISISSVGFYAILLVYLFKYNNEFATTTVVAR